MRMQNRLMGACLAMILCASIAVATVPDDIETADTVTRRATGKFGRGIVNITTGWGEMVYCPMEITKDRGYVLGATWGPLKGVAMTVMRTVSGVLEAGLFFYPLPGNYEPYFTREFVFSKPRPTVPPK